MNNFNHELHHDFHDDFHHNFHDDFYDDLNDKKISMSYEIKDVPDEVLPTKPTPTHKTGGSDEPPLVHIIISAAIVLALFSTVVSLYS